jgi:hypothetical protein
MQKAKTKKKLNDAQKVKAAKDFKTACELVVSHGCRVSDSQQLKGLMGIISA